jgi:hypothetical protein
MRVKESVVQHVTSTQRCSARILASLVDHCRDHMPSRKNANKVHEHIFRMTSWKNSSFQVREQSSK